MFTSSVNDHDDGNNIHIIKWLVKAFTEYAEYGLFEAIKGFNIKLFNMFHNVLSSRPNFNQIAQKACEIALCYDNFEMLAKFRKYEIDYRKLLKVVVFNNERTDLAHKFEHLISEHEFNVQISAIFCEFAKLGKIDQMEDLMINCDNFNAFANNNLALFNAAANGQTRTVEYLFDSLASLHDSHQADHSMNAFEVAAHNGHSGVLICMLMRHDCCEFTKLQQLQRALELARAGNHTTCAILLDHELAIISRQPPLAYAALLRNMFSVHSSTCNLSASTHDSNMCCNCCVAIGLDCAKLIINYLPVRCFQNEKNKSLNL